MEYLRELDVKLERLVMKRDVGEEDATPFSEDDEAAQVVREKLQGEGWSFFSHRLLDGGHRAVFCRGGILTSHVAEAPTLAMATAEAAVRAMEAWCGINKQQRFALAHEADRPLRRWENLSCENLAKTLVSVSPADEGRCPVAKAVSLAFLGRCWLKRDPNKEDQDVDAYAKEEPEPTSEVSSDHRNRDVPCDEGDRDDWD